MPAKVSPQLQRKHTIGPRFTDHEMAAIDIARGAQKPASWVRDLVLAELRRLDRESQHDTPRP